MTDDLRFERTARDWLELGPVEAPPDVVQAAFFEIDTTPQERDLRVPWRFPAMPRYAPVWVAAALAAVAAFGALVLLPGSPPNQGLVSTPSSTPAPGPSSPNAIALDAVFTSPTYGYTMPVASDWEITPASLTWTGPDDSDLVVDTMTIPGGDRLMHAASQPLAPAPTFDAWLHLFQPPVLAHPGTCLGGDPSTGPQATIGGRSWTIRTMCWGIAAVAQAGDRAFVFTIIRDPNVTDADRLLLERVLAGVQLDPEAALGVPPAPAVDRAFMSDRHCFSLRYPSSWAVLQRATTSPPTDRMPVPTNQSLDVIGTDQVRLSVTSLPLPDGRTPEAWVEDFCAFTRTEWTPPCDLLPGLAQKATLAEGEAWIAVNGDSGGFFPQGGSRQFLATATAGGRAYEIRLEGNVEQSLFLAILGSMTLDPAAAKDATQP